MRTHWRDRKEYISTKFKLDSNETCDTLLHDHISNFLEDIEAKDIMLYPDIKLAYSSISRIIHINDENIFLTAGAEQGIRAILHAHTDIIDININTPTFKLTEIYSSLYGYNIHFEPFIFSENTFNITGQPKKGITYIASPDNPTGYTYDLNYIESACTTSDVVILDRTYANHVNDEYLQLINEYNNLYIVKSFSKQGGAAGIRIGYIVSDKVNIDKLYNWRPMFEITSIACKYLKYMRDHPDILVASEININTGKEMLEAVLLKEGYNVIETSGNFCLVEYSKQLHEKLLKLCYTRVISINENQFIRITAASPDVMESIINEI